MMKQTETMAGGLRFVGRAVISGLLLRLVVVDSRAAADATMQAMYCEQVALAHSNAVALEAAWNAAAVRGQATEALTVTLEKAVNSQDLRLQVLRSPLIGAVGQAWSPSMNRAVHEIGGLSVVSTNVAGGATLRIACDIVIRFDADTLGQQTVGGAREVRGKLTLNLREAGANMAGAYSLDCDVKDGESRPVSGRIPAAKGKATGARTALAGPPAVDAKGWAPSKRDGPADLYELAQAIERAADGWYQKLRAVELARRGGRKYDDMLEALVFPMAASSTINFYTYQHPRNIYACAGTCLLRSGHAPHRWWVLGPVPGEQADAAIKASGGPAGPKACDETVTVDGKQHGWGPLYQTYLKLPDFKSWELDPANFADIHRLRRVVDLTPLVNAKGRGTYLLTTDLESDAPQTMRFEQTTPGVRAWVAGREVRHGDRIRFGTGVCRLFLQVDAGAEGAQSVQISPRFWASEDVEKERTAWVRAVERRRSCLEDAIRLAPESGEATAAKRLLQE